MVRATGRRRPETDTEGHTRRHSEGLVPTKEGLQHPGGDTFSVKWT